MSNIIAITCYNCSKQIHRVAKRLSSLDKTIYKEIIFIDNRSSDDTQEIIIKSIKEFSLNAKLLINNYNYGLGGSHKVAFIYAKKNKYNNLIIVHGDDQARPDINLEFMLPKNDETVLGSRFIKNSQRFGYQKSRVAGNRILNYIFTLITRQPVSDLGSGLNIFNICDLERINILELSDYFNFNVELLLGLIEKKCSYRFEPIEWHETDQVSNAKNINVALSMLKSLFVWKLQYKTIKVKKLKYTYEEVQL